MQSDMRIEFFDIEICAIEELFIIIIIIIIINAVWKTPTRKARLSIRNSPVSVGAGPQVLT